MPFEVVDSKGQIRFRIHEDATTGDVYTEWLGRDGKTTQKITTPGHKRTLPRLDIMSENGAEISLYTSPGTASVHLIGPGRQWFSLGVDGPDHAYWMMNKEETNRYTMFQFDGGAGGSQNWRNGPQSD